MAAVLACGRAALLSHDAAAFVSGLRPWPRVIDISVSGGRRPRVAGIHIRRRAGLVRADLRVCRGIPLTAPATTIVDIAQDLDDAALERVIGEADRLGLITPARLRRELDRHLRGRSGAAQLRRTLDPAGFRLTESELERRFIRIVRRAGLPLPDTGSRVCGYKADFHWPALVLVVETDGLRYHRTAAQQGRDRRRDQAFAAAGLTVLRFTYGQVTREAGAVEVTLTAVIGRLAGVAGPRPTITP